jgi:orotate phosphoribosyltransferase
VRPAVLTVARDELRRELAADLGRGGYVLRAAAQPGEERYFDKALVLSRPGLLTRAAELLADLLPETCERIAVTGVPSAALGTALSQVTGVPLLLGSIGEDDVVSFHGERYRAVKAVLLEDVVYTGGRASLGAVALERIGADVLGVICLLDRNRGGAQRLAEAGFALRTLFAEEELLQLAHGAGV